MSHFGRVDVKKEKKKALYLREIAPLVQEISLQEPEVAKYYVSRVDLSADTGICYVFFSSFQQGVEQEQEKDFKKALDILKLYKPSMRKALAQSINARYTPELIFAYDVHKEKERRINDLLDRVQQELSEIKDE